MMEHYGHGELVVMEIQHKIIEHNIHHQFKYLVLIGLVLLLQTDSLLPIVIRELDQSVPVQIPGTDWSSSLITIGSNESVFVSKTDGTVWAWGGNGPGTLGLNDRASRSSPTQLPGYWGDTPKFSAKGDFATALGSI